MLGHINTETPQAYSGTALDHLNAPDNLEGTLQYFLFSCQAEGLSSKTIKDYHQKLTIFIRFCHQVGITSLREITVDHIRAFVIERRKMCNSFSVKDYFCTTRCFFNRLVAEGRLDKSPMDTLKTPKVPKKAIEPFTPWQIRDQLLLCDEDTFVGARNKAIILMFLDTGLRLSEMANIQQEDVPMLESIHQGNPIANPGIIKVMGKGAKERFVRIGKGTQRALFKYMLKRLEKSDDYSCLWVTEERRPLHAEGIQTMIRRLGKRAGLKNVRCSPHTFRHTFATMALLNGAGEFNVQSLLGHSDLRMTRRYTASLTSERAVEAHKKFSPVITSSLSSLSSSSLSCCLREVSHRGIWGKPHYPHNR